MAIPRGDVGCAPSCPRGDVGCAPQLAHARTRNSRASSMQSPRGPPGLHQSVPAGVAVTVRKSRFEFSGRGTCKSYATARSNPAKILHKFLESFSRHAFCTQVRRPICRYATQAPPVWASRRNMPLGKEICPWGVAHSAPEATLGDMLKECPENAGPSEADRSGGPVGLWRSLYRSGSGALRRLRAHLDRWLAQRLTNSTRWHMVAASWGVMIGVSILAVLLPFIL